MRYLIYVLSITLILMTGCDEIKTSDPEEVYSHWTDGGSRDGIELLEGEYWQSGHWTKEYVMYLKLRPTKDWWKSYKEINGFERQRIDRVSVGKAEIFKIDDPDWIKKPVWFNPGKNSEVYGQFGGSKYFWDSESETLFIYEIQL
jgi:hypothetical protein